MNNDDWHRSLRSIAHDFGLALRLDAGRLLWRAGKKLVGKYLHADLREHAKKCPWGWYGDKVITSRLTTEAELLAWLQELERLASEAP